MRGSVQRLWALWSVSRRRQRLEQQEWQQRQQQQQERQERQRQWQWVGLGAWCLGACVQGWGRGCIAVGHGSRQCGMASRGLTGATCQSRRAL